MVIAFLNSTALVYGAVFIAFAAGAWFVMDLMASRKTRALERLSELKDPRKRALEKAVHQPRPTRSPRP